MKSTSIRLSMSVPIIISDWETIKDGGRFWINFCDYQWGEWLKNDDIINN